VFAVRDSWHGLPTLEDRFSATKNSFGLLRLLFAIGVLYAHTWPLGFGLPSPGDSVSRHQTDFGTSSLQGFIFMSGFFIAASGLRYNVRQFVWRRCLRILPGLWVCLCITALAFAPLVALYENGNLDGFWSHSDGPFSYIYTNLLASMEQYPISGLLANTPWGILNGGPAAFDGSLWTLRYEFGCYALIAILMATGLLRRAPRLLLTIAGVGYSLILFDVFRAGTWTIRPGWFGGLGPFPLIGDYAGTWVLYLGFYFVLGATARLYMHRIRMHGGLAIVAALVIVVTFRAGGFLLVGVPAFTYLVLYLAVALPERLTRIGHTRDYSLGVYIYGYPVQQLLALVGAARFGTAAFFVLSLAGSLALAIPSWHFIEAPALRMKDRKLSLRRRGVGHPAIVHSRVLSPIALHHAVEPPES
jgi:peptidoglycan/LPS O-acetylase OafA/YrhL